MKKFEILFENGVSKIYPGDCILIGGNSFISRGIKFFTNSKYSHVALAVSGTEVIEATAAGVEKNSIESLLKHADKICIRRIRSLTIEQVEIMKSKAYSLLYENYDTLQFISFIPYFIIRKLFGLNLHFLLFNSRTKMICSELYAVCAYAAGIKFTSSIKKIKKITPDDLYKSSLMDTIIEL